MTRVFALCDAHYFLEHHEAFYNSAIQVGYTPIIHLINPNEECIKIASELKNVHLEHQENITKPYFVINRFIRVLPLLRDQGIFISDIDTIFLKKLPKIEEDVGLCFRKRDKLYLQTCGTFTWYNATKGGKIFARRIANFLKNKNEWFDDQIALATIYDELKHHISFFNFTKEHVDWAEFNRNSYIWTGKGHRKRRSRYRKYKSRYEKGELNDEQ